MSNDEMMKASELGMPSEKAVENKKADKKAFKHFLIAIAVGGVVGFFAGFLGIEGKESMAQVGAKLLEGINWVTPFANFIIATVMWVVNVVWLRQARRIYATWDGEDESVIEKVELKISYGLIFTTVNMVLLFFFFGMGFYAVDFESGTLGWIRYGATMAGLIYSLALTTVFQKKFVNMTKEINPEKKGSVYDVKFQKIWLESCDESERLSIYKAAYASYKTTNYVCMAVLIVCILGVVLGDMGVLPMTMVTIIWLTLTICYEVECIRLAKHD